MAVKITTEATFPEHFVWGAATSSFQIEGAADADGKGPSIWDTFCRVPGAIADGSNGDLACDHYHRWPRDIEVMGELGLDAYRFSVAWPRVVPDGAGPTNAAGLDFYDRLVDALVEAGIAPAVTLYHWDLPQALGDTGGWLSRDTAYAFADYAEAVVARLGDRVRWWMTLNEPYVSAHLGYALGEHAPGHRDLGEALTASHHLLLGHGLALERLRSSVRAPAQCGVVVNFTPVDAASDADDDVAAARRVDDIENRWYADALAGFGYPAATAAALGWSGDEVHDGDLELIAAPVDVVGINFYTRQVVAEGPSRPPIEGPVTDMGWEIHPPSFGRLLRDLHERYPFAEYLITENGAAMPDTTRMPDGRVDDRDRIAYLHDHLAEVASAVADGVPVTGYFAWSLLDNFEWAFGYEKRFGIVEVVQGTLERRLKRSALWYRDVIDAGGVVAVPSPADG